MSSSRFAAFSNACVPIAGVMACEKFAAYLRTCGRGQRLLPTRIALDLGLEEEDLDDILRAATQVGLLQLCPQVRCPHCEARLDLDELLAEQEQEGFATCPDCSNMVEEPRSLRSELRYRLAAEADAEVAARQAAEQAKPRMRAVVLCALLVELRAVRAQMETYGAVGEQVIAGGEIYLTGTLAGQHVNWDVRAACSERTNAAAAASLTNAINSFNPEVALYVGVAGGIAGKVELGDVVAATTVFDYDHGKDTATGYEPRELQLHSSFDLRQRALHVAASEDWKASIAPATADPGGTFTAHVEPIAAGSKVITAAGSPTAQLIASIAPRAVAVETEGAGFLAAVERFATVSGIVVRGISDMLDGKQASDKQGWQPQASARATAFAFELLHRFQPPTL
jgi:nucleoside phosphorylase